MGKVFVLLLQPFFQLPTGYTEQGINEASWIPPEERRCFTKDAAVGTLPHRPHWTMQTGL